MVTGPTAGEHADCGAPVRLAAGAVSDPDGAPHLCCDYVAWHQPADTRDPGAVDVAGGWQPPQLARVAA